MEYLDFASLTLISDLSDIIHHGIPEFNTSHKISTLHDDVAMINMQK